MPADSEVAGMLPKQPQNGDALGAVEQQESGEHLPLDCPDGKHVKYFAFEIN